VSELKFAPNLFLSWSKFLSKRLLIPETLFEDIFPRLLDEALLGQDEGGRGGHAAVVVLLRHLEPNVVKLFSFVIDSVGK